MTEFISFIEKATSGKDLTVAEAGRAVQIMLSGGATTPQIAAYIAALRTKGECAEEIAGTTLAIRAKIGKINSSKPVTDISGTGGTNEPLLNISTCSAIVAAASGVAIAKHGNRSFNNMANSAEVLQELGVNIKCDNKIVERCLEEANICFMYTPKFFHVMRDINMVREELQIHNIFDFAAPLCNPAGVKRILLGVPQEDYLELMVKVLQLLDYEHSWIVCGACGIDELTVRGNTKVLELKEGKISSFDIIPDSVGLETVFDADLEGGNLRYNAEQIIELLKGKPSPFRDTVVLNSAALMFINERVETLKEGVSISQDLIDSGEAQRTLKKLIELSNSEVR